MKELKFRYTDHGSYGLARSFFVMVGMVAFASGIDFIMFILPVNWLALGTAGSVIRAVLMGAGVVVGIYLGFRLALKLFDREGTVIIDDDKLIIKLGRKEHKFYIKDIKEVNKDIFARFDGLRFKDNKTIGPLFTKHSIITDNGEFFVMASTNEGWTKAGKSIFDKENPVPIYSIDNVFKEISAHVKEVNKRGDTEAHDE